MGVGLALALGLTLLSVVKIDGGRLTLRDKPLYQSQATLLLTQRGFPWGSAVQGYAQTLPSQPPTPIGDAERLTNLTDLYVEMAKSDAVQVAAARLLMDRASTIQATRTYTSSPAGYSSSLPMIALTGISTTPAKAIRAAEAGVQAFRLYVTQQQRVAGIKAQDRVLLQELRSPSAARKIGGPKKTLALFLFFTAMTSVLALAFVLENLRPGIRAVSDRQDAVRDVLSARRPA